MMMGYASGHLKSPNSHAFKAESQRLYLYFYMIFDANILSSIPV